MTWLPIVGRELRVTARQGRHYWGRMVFAALALGVGMFVFSSFGYGSLPSSLGRMMFGALAWLVWLYCATAGARLTADALSAERREGTLGLLFLTDLRGYDVVLGKFAAGSLNALYGVLTTVPVLALPLLLGGVAMTQVGRVVAVLLATLFFSLSAGIFVSCWFENGLRARGATLLVLMAVILGPFGVMLLPFLGEGPQPSEPNFWLAMPSPMMALSLATTPPAAGKPDEFYLPSLACAAGLGMLFLLGACVVLPRVWRAVPRLLPTRTPAASRPLVAEREAGVACHRRLLEINPFYWRTSRSRLGPLWVLLVFLLLGVLWGWFTGGADLGRDPGWAITSALLLGLVFKVWIVLAAARPLAEERRTGSMELLLSTPLTVRQIVGGQLRALGRRFGAVFLLLLLTNFGLWKMAVEYAYGDHDLLNWMAVCHVAALGVDSLALALLGMWAALRARNASQAAGTAFFRVVILPGVVLGGTLMLIMALGWDRLLGHVSDLELLLGFYLLCFVNNLFWLGHAVHRLRTRFREAATQRFTPGGGWFLRRSRA